VILTCYEKIMMRKIMACYAFAHDVRKSSARRQARRDILIAEGAVSPEGPTPDNARVDHLDSPRKLAATAMIFLM
jgi:hypothetical protein